MRASSETKRIAVLDTGREWGGGTNSLLELLKRIDRSRYKLVAIFHHNYRKGESSDIKRELEMLDVEFVLVPEGRLPPHAKLFKEITRVFLAFNKSLQKDLIFSFDYLFRLKSEAGKIAEILRRHRMDLLYMNNQPASNLGGILAAEMVGVPAVLHCRIAKKVPSLAIKKANAVLKRVICVSHGLRDFYVSQGLRPELCVVVHNGIDPRMRPRKSREIIRKEWGLSNGDFVIGTVCSLLKRKHVEDLIRAFSLLKEPNLKLMIVGEGPEREHLASLVEKLGLTERVIFTGFQTDPLSFIEAMDIFVLPSEKEGLPRVILEAMLLRKPVIATRIPGPSELIEDGLTGFLVEPRCPEELAAKIKMLFKNPRLFRAMGERGYRRVIRNFSIEKYVSGVTRVLEEVLSCCT